MYRVWVGKRESDIATCDYFDFSITFYGTGENQNVSFCKKNRIVHNYGQEFTSFVLKHVEAIIDIYKSDCEFHFYNNIFAYKLCKINPSLKNNFVNLNSQDTLNFLRHKTLSRLWLSNDVKTPAFTALSAPECTIKNMATKFKGFDEFVIQKNYSGGGTGTYLLTKKSENDIKNQLTNEQLYLVSPYYTDRQDYSCHILVDNNTYVILAISKQIIVQEGNNLKYHGNTYFNHDDIEYKKIHPVAAIIAQKLQAIDYRGICGVDFIMNGEDVIVIELNPRYLGSSFAVNYVLHKNSLPSLFEATTACFQNKLSMLDINTIAKTYLSVTNACYFYNAVDVASLKNIRQRHDVIIYDDGYLSSDNFESNAYLGRALFLF